MPGLGRLEAVGSPTPSEHCFWGAVPGDQLAKDAEEVVDRGHSQALAMEVSQFVSPPFGGQEMHGKWWELMSKAVSPQHV